MHHVFRLAVDKTLSDIKLASWSCSSQNIPDISQPKQVQWWTWISHILTVSYFASIEFSATFLQMTSITNRVHPVCHLLRVWIFACNFELTACDQMGSTVVKCPKCNKELSSTQSVDACPTCPGSSTSSTQTKCIKCGKELTKDNEACPSCFPK